MVALGTAAILAACLLLCSATTATATAGDSFLGDLVTASASPVNGGTFKDTVGGYGSVSIIDNGESYSWEVDIFQTTVPFVIELSLTRAGLPTILNLTDDTNPPSPDGISFGIIEYNSLTAAIAASPNPSANLQDGSIAVVAKMARPANSALVAQLSDGTDNEAPILAPPSPPDTTPPAPDVANYLPGETPTIYYSILDGSQVYILESGLPGSANSTASMLLYKWSDKTYTFEIQVNGVASPSGLTLRVFKDLVNQPVVLNLTTAEPWSPDTTVYTGNFTEEALQAGLQAAGAADSYLDNSTPDLFLQLIDQGGVSVDTQYEDQLAAAPAPSNGGLGGTVANVRRRSLLQNGSLEPHSVANGTDSGDGTCSNVQQQSRLLGFLYNAYSRYKLKPILKDSSSIPSTVADIPLYTSIGIIALFGVWFITNYVSGVVEVAQT